MSTQGERFKIELQYFLAKAAQLDTAQADREPIAKRKRLLSELTAAADAMRRRAANQQIDGKPHWFTELLCEIDGAMDELRIYADVRFDKFPHRDADLSALKSRWRFLKNLTVETVDLRDYVPKKLCLDPEIAPHYPAVSRLLKRHPEIRTEPVGNKKYVNHPAWLRMIAAEKEKRQKAIDENPKLVKAVLAEKQKTEAAISDEKKKCGENRVNPAIALTQLLTPHKK